MILSRARYRNSLEPEATETPIAKVIKYCSNSRLRERAREKSYETWKTGIFSKHELYFLLGGGLVLGTGCLVELHYRTSV